MPIFDTTLTAEPIPNKMDRFRAYVPSLSRVVLGLLFVLIGYSKFDSNPRGEWVRIFEQIGLGQWFRYLTGLLEVAGGIGLLIPRYAFYAAILLVIVMIGAIITHVAVVGGSPAPAASLFVLSGIIAWLRKP